MGIPSHVPWTMLMPYTRGPCCTAALHGRLSVTELLVEHGVPIGAHDANGRSPLVLALQKTFGGPHINVANLLLQHGALPAADSAEAGDLLLEIASSGIVQLMEYV